MGTGHGLRTSSDLIADIPRDAPLRTAYTQLGSDFGSGRMWPYTLLMVPPAHSGGVLNKVTWETCQNITKSLAENPKLHNTSLRHFMFPFYASGGEVPWWFVNLCVKDLQ